MIAIIVVLSLLVVVLGFTTFNLLRKNESFEETSGFYNNYLVQFSKIIAFCDKKLKELDVKGAFASDDEIGFIFEEIKKLQSLLNEFKVVDIDGDPNTNPEK